MQMYLHDNAKSFEFVLQGELTGDAVQSLEQTWITATSVLGGKEVSVNVSSLTAADAEGRSLLTRMTRSGARLTAARPPKSVELLHSLSLLTAVPSRRSGQPWSLGVRRLFGLST